MTPPDERSQPPLARFAVRSGPRAGAELPVRAPELSIGQAPQNDLVLADDSVSSRHAELRFDAGAWRLTDLDSTNGTFVAGVRLAPRVPTPLPDGAEVRFGGVRLHFQAAPDADPEAVRAAAPPPPPPPRSRRLRLPVWAFLLILILLGLLIFFVVRRGAARGPAGPTTPTAPLVAPAVPPAPGP